VKTSAVDPRALFFLVAAALAYALTPVADAEHRWVAIATGTTYVVLAVLAALDGRSRSKDDE
jgi:hypothetical protein